MYLCCDIQNTPKFFYPIIYFLKWDDSQQVEICVKFSPITPKKNNGIMIRYLSFYKCLPEVIYFCRAPFLITPKDSPRSSEKHKQLQFNISLRRYYFLQHLFSTNVLTSLLKCVLMNAYHRHTHHHILLTILVK